jgi:hemerythrin-like domain-containing protein
MLPGFEEHRSTVEAAKALADPTGVLLADHEWVRYLLKEFRKPASSPDGGGELLEFCSSFEPLLDLHIRQEEEAYFLVVEPYVLRLTEGSTEDMYGEHDAIRVALSDLLAALARQHEVAVAYSALERSLLVHFENEEELVFAEAPSQLSHGERLEILERFENIR